MVFLLEDLFDIKDIDQDGKKFDNGVLFFIFISHPHLISIFVFLLENLVLSFLLERTKYDLCGSPQCQESKLKVKRTIFILPWM